jgi:hypothetical protein
MDKINFSAPVNSLSFGNVSVNMLRSLYKKGIKVTFFPIGQKLDFTAFDNLTDDFTSWVNDCYDNRFKTLDPDTPSLKMWHINGAESRIGRKQHLYTFYECDKPTDIEKNICSMQDSTIFSSSHAKDCFENSSVDNCKYVPIGIDPDIYETGKTYLKDRINFGLIGKFEKRKHTARIIKLWADRYGNNNDYQLTCCITNPFFKPEQMAQVLSQSLGNTTFTNINFLPYLKTNSEMNEVYNSIDINLSGLSGAEGWNLPAFNSTCLGKWSIVLNATSHKDWANEENSILVNPDSKEDIYDGAFFVEGSEFNQGQLNCFSDESFYSATDKALSKVGEKNEKGVEIKHKFTYDNSIDQILNIMSK